jgi:hypothetical protein
VFAGGGFNSVGGVDRPGLAAIDLSTGQATSWDPGLAPIPVTPPVAPSPPFVSALAAAGSTLYVAGGFSALDGESRDGLGAYDVTTGQPTGWNPAPNGEVGPIIARGQTIYAAGFFTEIGGQPRNGLAALDAASGQATTWDPDPDNIVTAMAAGGSTVYVAGYFRDIGGQTRDGLAALDAGTGTAAAWAPAITSRTGQRSVHALAVSGSTVYMGGAFQQINGATRRGVGAVDAVTGKVTAFTANTVNTTAEKPNEPGVVNAIAPTSTALYVGGNFTSIRGADRDEVAALPPNGSGVSSWNPDANPSPAFRFDQSTVDVVVADGSVVLIGGGFTLLGDRAQQGFAELPAP